MKPVRLIRSVWPAPLALALSACGGGGGSDVTSTPISVSLNQTAISFQGYEGDAITSQQPQLFATLSPESADVYGDVQIDRPDLFDTAFGILSPTQGIVSIRPKTTVSAGSYAGKASVRACKDPACSIILASAALTYTMEVKPGLKVAPDNVAIRVPVGTTNTLVQTLTVTLPTDPGSLTAVPSSSLIPVVSAPMNGVAFSFMGLPGGLNYAVTTYLTNAQPGTYEGFVRFFYQFSGNPSKTLVREVRVAVIVN